MRGQLVEARRERVLGSRRSPQLGSERSGTAGVTPASTPSSSTQRAPSDMPATEREEGAHAGEHALPGRGVAVRLDRRPCRRISSSARSESPGSTLHAAHAFRVHDHLEALPQAVERRVLDAVVGRQADHGQLRHVAPRAGPPPARSRRSPSSPRCTWSCALVDHEVQPPAVEGGVQLARPRCPARSAPARSRPCSTNEPWSSGCQSRVATTRSKPGSAASSLTPLGDHVPVRHGERAAGREVVLEVDDHERLRHRLR